MLKLKIDNMKTEKQTPYTKHVELNLWIVYTICLFLSAIFFLLFGFNSPIFKFNTDHDYQWFMTMGNGLVNGKIPYRDLFEQKGPIVFFVTAFCCLFPKPGVIMLILEILSMSLFFFFAYRICHKILNSFYSLLAILLITFAIFTSWCRIFSAATVEEFMLPICAYVLLCWLEFLIEKHHWNSTRAMCLGICLSIMLWTKYTLLYFALTPLVSWLIISLRRQQYQTLVVNLAMMLCGAIIISTPILWFYALHHALDNLFHVYFYINLTVYTNTSLLTILSNFTYIFKIGPFILALIILGIIYFTIKHWTDRSGWLLLISFLVNIILISISTKGITYYYGVLIPYGILGALYFVNWLKTKFNLQQHAKIFFITFTCSLLLLCIPCSVTTKDWGRKQNEYTPLVVAEVIQNYASTHNTEATLFCYKLWDYGFYNALNITPNQYYYANNYIPEEDFPAMYTAFEHYIKNQNSNFVITELDTWEKEKDFLGTYYQLYDKSLSNSTFSYNKNNYVVYKNYQFVLLIKK